MSRQGTLKTPHAADFEVYNPLMRWSVAMALVLCSAACGAACGKSGAEQRAEDVRARQAALAADPELSDALGRQVLAQSEAHAPGWIKQDKLYRGTLAERARQDFLAVLTDGHCYRFLAAAGPEVGDLDLALYDANNVEVQRDVTEDPTPRLGAPASLCPSESMAYRIEARMRRGHGPFAIGLFRSAE
jgi:hypothetical protein